MVTMKQQIVIKLSHEDVHEICAAIRDGFSSIALALAESLGFGTPAACIQSAAHEVQKLAARLGKVKAK